MGMEAMHELQAKRWPEFERVIEYDNKQLEETDIRVYRQLLDLFTSKMHLAEPSIRTHLAL
jgi:stress response protein YsnF